MATGLVGTNGKAPADAAVAALTSAVTGPVLSPTDEGFAAARRIWNGMIDRTPGLIVRAQSEQDVVAAVNFARDNELLLSVKGGGHSFPGHSVCQDGLMLDLSLMKAVDVDPAGKTATAQGGVLWGEFDAATTAHGLAVTGGQISHTGIAGLTLGGGFGWLCRRDGLSIDNLLSATVVTADGDVRTASADSEPELFWAIRGGGGNFGVVTSFTYRLYPLGLVNAGQIGHPLPKAPEVFAFAREYAEQAPDELCLTLGMLTTPDGHAACAIVYCWSGDEGEGEKVLEPLKTFSDPVMNEGGPMPYTVAQTFFDEATAIGSRYYMRSHMLDAISDEAIGTMVDAYSKIPSPLGVIVVPQLGGAVSRVPQDATAFAQRSATWSFTGLTRWEDPSEDEANRVWARDLGDKMAKLGSGGVYVNELFDEGQDRVRAAYGSSYDRLVAAKRTYDPGNLFRMNQNIVP